MATRLYSPGSDIQDKFQHLDFSGIPTRISRECKLAIVKSSATEHARYAQNKEGSSVVLQQQFETDPNTLLCSGTGNCAFMRALGRAKDLKSFQKHMVKVLKDPDLIILYRMGCHSQKESIGDFASFVTEYL